MVTYAPFHRCFWPLGVILQWIWVILQFGPGSASDGNRPPTTRALSLWVYHSIWWSVFSCLLLVSDSCFIDEYNEPICCCNSVSFFGLKYFSSKKTIESVYAGQTRYTNSLFRLDGYQIIISFAPLAFFSIGDTYCVFFIAGPPTTYVHMGNCDRACHHCKVDYMNYSSIYTEHDSNGCCHILGSGLSRPVST